MRPFSYDTAGNLEQAVRLGALTGQGQADANTQFLAGGTTLVDLMRLDVLRPHRVVNIGGLHTVCSGGSYGCGIVVAICCGLWQCLDCRGKGRGKVVCCNWVDAE